MADKLQMTFTGGELSPQAYGRVDLAKYQSGLKTLRNFYVHPLGGVVNRAGTEFVGYTKNQDAAVREIPFEYNADQQYVLEFGHQYMRIKLNGGYVVEPSYTINGIASFQDLNGVESTLVTCPGGDVFGVTESNPALVTLTAPHNFSDGDRAHLSGIPGIPEINDQDVIVGTTTDDHSFKILLDDGTYFNSEGYLLICFSA